MMMGFSVPIWDTEEKARQPECSCAPCHALARGWAWVARLTTSLNSESPLMVGPPATIVVKVYENAI